MFFEQKENKTKYPFQGPPWVLGAGIKWTRRMQGRNNAIEAAGFPSPLTALAVKLNPAVSSEPRSMGQLSSGQATWVFCFCQNSPLGTCEQHRTSFLTSWTTPAGDDGPEFDFSCCPITSLLAVENLSFCLSYILCITPKHLGNGEAGEKILNSAYLK